VNAGQIAEAVASREISPVELAEEALRSAEAWQPVTNAFSQLRPEETVGEAKRLADALAGGAAPGPLAGVAVAVKDLFDVRDWETTGCCAAFRGRVATGDAEAVRRLRAAGAVVVGKTNQHELAAGATNVVSACGPTRNPWDPERITGGSSGGSAAAVASGVVPLALGTDTGGSIRIPASFCGTSGLKPGHGTIPMDGAMPLSPSLDTAGPLASSAEDLSLAFSVLSGTATALEDVNGRTVALLTGDAARTAREDVLEATDRVAEVLAGAGARVSTVELAGTEDALEVWDHVAWAELAECYPELIGSTEVHPRTRGILEFGRGAGDRLAWARERMEAIGQAFRAALRDADALLLPATPSPAPRLGDRVVSVGGVGLDVRTGAPSVLTRPVSLSRLPALALPSGVSREGLPLGAQLVGRPESEGLLISLAAAFQERSDHHLRAPEVTGPSAPS
jgi:Asp-tRNA(Asn)/Glu-tRNA(Gln) amidotransferase A subunit family amidase